MHEVELLLQNAQNAQSTIEKKTALNKVRLLMTVFKKEMVTANNLSQEMGLSFPTINGLIVDLQEAGMLVAKEKGESIGGRRPVLYQLNHRVATILCVEIERFSVRLIVLDNNGYILHEPLSYDHEISASASKLDDLVDIIHLYLNERQVNLDQLTAIGLSMPGLVNHRELTNQTFYTGGTNICSYIGEKFGKYVTMLNDVKAAAFSELVFGAAKNKNNVLVILMDWGIGLGIVVNGEVYMGNDGFAGEMGHMVFVEDGNLCYCGKRGCLETIASGVYLVNQAQEDIANGTPTLLKNLTDLKRLLPQHIIQVANEGDQYAIDLISALGINLGKAISLLMQVLNPDTIVLSGKFAKAGTLITIPIQQSINTYTMNAIRKNCALELSPLDENGYAKGLMRYTFERYFEDQLNQVFD